MKSFCFVSLHKIPIHIIILGNLLLFLKNWHSVFISQVVLTEWGPIQKLLAYCLSSFFACLGKNPEMKHSVDNAHLILISNKNYLCACVYTMCKYLQMMQEPWRPEGWLPWSWSLQVVMSYEMGFENWSSVFCIDKCSFLQGQHPSPRNFLFKLQILRWLPYHVCGYTTRPRLNAKCQTPFTFDIIEEIMAAFS